MSKILFVYTDYFTIYDIAWAFLELGHELEIYAHKFLCYEDNTPLLEPFTKHLEQDDYRFVLTYNFCADLSRICEQKKLPYVCWTYDALCLPLYQTQLQSPYNFTHIFDSEEYRMLTTQFHPPHLYYMPLAANTSRINGTVLSAEDTGRYAADVSFVGNLYEKDEFQTLEEHQLLPQKLFDYFSYLFSYYTERWNGESIYDCLDTQTCTLLNQILPTSLHNPYAISDNFYYAFTLLGRRVAHLDRMRILKRLSARFQVALYGPIHPLPFTIDQRGSVDYETEFAKVAALSKINLHVTIPKIPAGASLRCFDIMGAGGFLMANYRRDLVDLFEPDRDFVLYTDIDDLIRKTEYYLTHEDARLAIAKNGYRTIQSRHTCQHRAMEMLLHLETAGY